MLSRLRAVSVVILHFYDFALRAVFEFDKQIVGDHWSFSRVDYPDFFDFFAAYGKKIIERESAGRKISAGQNGYFDVSVILFRHSDDLRFEPVLLSVLREPFFTIIRAVDRFVFACVFYANIFGKTIIDRPNAVTALGFGRIIRRFFGFRPRRLSRLKTIFRRALYPPL
jgi:hypothetical protein